MIDTAKDIDNLLTVNIIRSSSHIQIEKGAHFIMRGKVVGTLRQCGKKVVDLFVHDGPVILCGFVVEMLLAYSAAQTPVVSIWHQRDQASPAYSDIQSNWSDNSKTIRKNGSHKLAIGI